MDHEEGQIIIRPKAGLNVDVVDEVDEVKRQPGHAKYKHHGYQHPVSPSLPFPETRPSDNNLE